MYGIFGEVRRKLEESDSFGNLWFFSILPFCFGLFYLFFRLTFLFLFLSLKTALIIPLCHSGSLEGQGHDISHYLRQSSK